MARIEKYQFQDIGGEGRTIPYPEEVLPPSDEADTSHEDASFEPSTLEGDGHTPPPPPETIVLEKEELEKRLREAEEKGYQRGKNDGITAGRAEAEAQAQAYQEALLQAVTGLTGEIAGQQAAWEDWKKAHTSLLATVTRRITEHLTEETLESVTEAITAMIRECLDILLAQPSISVQVHSDLARPLEEALEGIPEYNALSGKLLIETDNTMHLGQCRVKWNNGEAVLDRQQQWNDIEQVILRYLSAVPDIRTDDMPPAAPPPANTKAAAVMPENTDSTELSENDPVTAPEAEKGVAIDPEVPEN